MINIIIVINLLAELESLVNSVNHNNFLIQCACDLFCNNVKFVFNYTQCTSFYEFALLVGLSKENASNR